MSNLNKRTEKFKHKKLRCRLLHIYKSMNSNHTLTSKVLAFKACSPLISNIRKSLDEPKLKLKHLYFRIPKFVNCSTAKC
ncbi:hypothetical protein HanIR_Chr05g0241871 [Helianthus annuus]|nr:hypothetical protein HanIR_Chr05g0241871 [Helianthus annuus]